LIATLGALCLLDGKLLYLNFPRPRSYTYSPP